VRQPPSKEKEEKREEKKLPGQRKPTKVVIIIYPVSWKWGAGNPAGTVAETKEEGEIAITTQRGNTVTKKADPSNPAVRVERSGNDVVKRASELSVDEKASGSGSGGGQDDDHATEENDPHQVNSEGKEIKKGGGGKGTRRGLRSQD